MMQDSTQPLVSVITPVYNGETFLAACIKSVLGQSYANFEYIIVNNCSTDATLQIAERYAANDPRVRIHTNTTFVSALENHNTALKLISPDSRYVKFVQADDWIYPECIAQMVAVTLRHPSIGLVSAYRLEGIRVTLDGLPYPSTFVSGAEICRQSLLTDLYVFGSPTSVLMRADLIRSRPALYDETNFTLEADSAACFDLLQTSDFGFVHQVLTTTHRHHEQLTTASMRLKTWSVTRIKILDRYGPVFLSAAEHANRRKDLMTKHLRLIGWKALTETDEGFWRFQRKALADFGYKRVSLTIMTAAFLVVCKMFWNAAREVAEALKVVAITLIRLMVRAIKG